MLEYFQFVSSSFVRGCSLFGLYWENTSQVLFCKFMDHVAGEVHKLAKKEREASSIKFLLQAIFEFPEAQHI